MSHEALIDKKLTRNQSSHESPAKTAAPSVLATDLDAVKIIDDNPRLGTLYWCLSGFVFCLNFMCGKVLYERHPDLSTNELLVYRSLISIVLLALYLN